MEIGGIPIAQHTGAPAPKKKHGCLIAFLVVVGLAALGAFISYLNQPPGAPMPMHVDYTNSICDNAYQTENRTYANGNPPYIDITLHEGCFSGFVQLPSAWRTWQFQMLHNAPDAWAAYWWRGWSAPRGPFSGGQINAATNTLGQLPSYEVRFEGRGTIRFYRTTP